MTATSKDIFKMQKDIDFLKKGSYSQGRDLIQIKKALLGDEYNDGFKQRIEATELKTKEFEHFAQRVKYATWATVAGLTLIGTAVTIIKNWAALI